MRLITLCILALFGSSCTKYKFKNQNNQKVNFKKAKYFENKSSPIKPELIPSKSVETKVLILDIEEFFHIKSYNVFSFSFPSANPLKEGDNEVKAFYYKPKKIKDPIPLILVFPILAGNHIISEWQAKKFARKGFAVVRFEKKPGFLKVDQPLEYHPKVIQQTIIDAKRALDWLVTLPEIDKSKIGVAGVSMGAICANLLMGTDKRISAGSFFLLGGNIPYILKTSKERSVIKMRKRLMEKEKILLKDFEKTLKPIFKNVDPITYAKNIDPSKVIMFSAKRDQVIHKKAASEIWEAMRKPQWIQVPFAGHYSAFFYFFYGTGKSAKFFKKTFNWGN